MSQKKRKFRYVLFKLLSVLVSCGLPIYAVCEHFPVWTVSHGTSHTVGAGAVISVIVIAIVFRRSVFAFLRDKMNLRHAPPVSVWIFTLMASYILLYLNRFIRDLTTVSWFGLLGCAIGTLLTWIAEKRYGAEKEARDE